MSRPLIAGLALVFAVVAALLSPLPASAHDQLVSSTPAEGERLGSAPTEVTLSFSGELLPMGAIIMVVDGDDRDWVDDDPTIELTTITAPLKEGLVDAGYELRWQVVSSDGHPISGIVPFTIGDGEPLSRDGAATTEGDGSEGDDTADAGEQATQGITGVARIALLGGGGAAVAVALFAIIQFTRRRADAGGADGSDPLSDSSDSL